MRRGDAPPVTSLDTMDKMDTITEQAPKKIRVSTAALRLEIAKRTLRLTWERAIDWENDKIKVEHGREGCFRYDDMFVTFSPENPWLVQHSKAIQHQQARYRELVQARIDAGA